jgi:hypothetical protein
MNKEIGNVAGISIMVNPETYEDIKKRKTIYENEILIELQQRIDKAIEYIEKNKHLNWYVESCYISDLLKLLKGEE